MTSHIPEIRNFKRLRVEISPYPLLSLVPLHGCLRSLGCFYFYFYCSHSLLVHLPGFPSSEIEKTVGVVGGSNELAFYLVLKEPRSILTQRDKGNSGNRGWYCGFGRVLGTLYPASTQCQICIPTAPLLPKMWGTFRFPSRTLLAGLSSWIGIRDLVIMPYANYGLLRSTRVPGAPLHQSPNAGMGL